MPQVRVLVPEPVFFRHIPTGVPYEKFQGPDGTVVDAVPFAFREFVYGFLTDPWWTETMPRLLILDSLLRCLERLPDPGEPWVLAEEDRRTLWECVERNPGRLGLSPLLLVQLRPHFDALSAAGPWPPPEDRGK
jgi:hypothetical protein